RDWSSDVCSSDLAGRSGLTSTGMPRVQVPAAGVIGRLNRRHDVRIIARCAILRNANGHSRRHPSLVSTRRIRMKTVAQLLRDKQHQNVHTISSEATVLEFLQAMAEHNVGALPVVDNGELVGIVSERDYARKIVLQGRSSVGTPVSTIMSSPVITTE